LSLIPCDSLGMEARELQEMTRKVNKLHNDSDTIPEFLYIFVTFLWVEAYKNIIIPNSYRLEWL